LHWLEHADLAEMLQRYFRAPAIIVQEIRALALGQLAAEPGAEDFLLADFGEGVGGAIVLNGKLYSAPMPLSGELGHTPVPGNTRRCGCGGVGCLETLISEHGLLETFSAATGQRRSWELLVKRVATHGLEPWLSETLNSAANVLVGALNVLGVHRLVVTGKVTGLPGCAVEHMLAKVRQGALWARFGEVHCATAPRRRAAGLIAAGLDRLVFPSG
jgi:predicted NBD/HSP70 family sugar kinase